MIMTELNNTSDYKNISDKTKINIYNGLYLFN